MKYYQNIRSKLISYDQYVLENKKLLTAILIFVNISCGLSLGLWYTSGLNLIFKYWNNWAKFKDNRRPIQFYILSGTICTKGILSRMVGMVVGALISMPVMKFIGRKLTMLFSSFLMFGATFGIFSHKYELLIFTRSLVGVSVGLNITTGPLYCTENSPVRVRGIVGTSFGVMSGVMLGFISLLLPNWKWMFGLNFFTAVALFCSFVVMPESSFWRGNKLKEFEEKINEELMNTPRYKDERGVIRKLLCDKRNLGKFLIGIVLIIAYQFGGQQTVVNYLPKILEDVHIRGLSQTVASIVVASWNLVTCLFSLVLVDMTGRRILICVGMGIMFFCTFTMGFVFAFVPNPYNGWIFLFMVIFYLIGNNIGIGSLIFLLFTELFDESTRDVAQPVLSSALNVVQFLVGLFYLPVVALIGQGGTFWLISGFNLITWILFLLFLPETKTKMKKGYEAQRDQKLDDDDENHDNEEHEANPNEIHEEHIELEDSGEHKIESKSFPTTITSSQPLKFNSSLHWNDLREFTTKNSTVVVQLHQMKGFEPELPNGHVLVAWIQVFDEKRELKENYFIHFGELSDQHSAWFLEKITDDALSFEYLLGLCVQTIENRSDELDIKGFKTIMTVKDQGRPSFQTIRQYFIKESLLLRFPDEITIETNNGDFHVHNLGKDDKSPVLPSGWSILAIIELKKHETVQCRYVLSRKTDMWRIDLLDSEYNLVDLLYLCEQNVVQDDMKCLTQVSSGTGEIQGDLLQEKLINL